MIPRRADRLLIALAALLFSATPIAAADLVTVTWVSQAPDMPDMREFNDSGTLSVPFTSNCGTAFTLTRVHVFGFFLGSTRGEDHKPFHDGSAGVALTVQIGPEDARSLVSVDVDAGEGDWTNAIHLLTPIYSREQTQTLGSEVTWVVPHEGVALPKFWKKVALNCRRRGA